MQDRSYTMKRLIPLVVIAALCLTALAGATPTAAQSGNVWRLDYYNNLDWAGSPVTTAFNSFISFNWGYGSPSPAVPVDNFTGRFTTDAYFYAGNYTFTLTSDDEVALIVDGVTLLDTRNAGASGKTFTVNFGMWEGTHHIEALYREYTQLAYVYINWAYGKPGTTPPPPPTQPTPVPPPPSNCAPQSASSVQTEFGNYTPCIQQGSHQSACFQSNGAWNAPNMGSIETEPQIVIWGNCTPDSWTNFPISCDPNVPQQSYKCSKTGAGWFPG
jgi:hypothetical protein